LLTSRNSQLESDLQRLQLQQRNNQLALERLDEYEETISQLQEELDQLRLNKKTPSEEKTLERQIIKLNEELQSLENANYQLQQQLQSKDRLFQTTPGSPPSINSSANLSSLYDQFITLLPNEFTSSDNTHLSLSDRFIELFEQFSTYIGTFSIIQEELDSLKQILNEKQDELEKLRSHFELTTNKLTQLQEEQSLNNKTKSYESDEDELEEILGFQQRAPSLNSLLSITPGEKQQLIAQNELLSSLLTDKEQELIQLQQAEKTREDLMKTLRLNLQQMEFDKEIKQIELNDIRNILDEKLRENSSLKKEKMFFIEKLAQFERERQSTSDDIDLLRSILNEREIQLQKLIDQEKQWFSKQSELELSLKLFEENNSKLISNQKLFEQIQLDLKRITHERDLAIVEKKQMEDKVCLVRENQF
jgi:chromosome segregation ATPase